MAASAWASWVEGKPVVLEKKSAESADNWYILVALAKPEFTKKYDVYPKLSKLEVKHDGKEYSAKVVLDEFSILRRADVIEGKWLRVELEHYKPRETVVFDLETAELVDQDYCDPRDHACAF